MRILILIFAVSTALITSCSKEVSINDVPSVVVNSLKTAFPGAVNLEWEQRQDQFNVEFDVDHVEHEAVIDSSGQLIMHKREIPTTEAPALVLEKVNMQFPDKELEDVEIIQRNGETYYEIEFESLFRDKTHIFTEQGELESSFSF